MRRGFTHNVSQLFPQAVLREMDGMSEVEQKVRMH